MLTFTDHSMHRFRERMVSSLGGIHSQLWSALVNGDYYSKPPLWYRDSKGRKDSESLRWVRFKDADSVEAAGLVNLHTGEVVTLVKKL